MCNDSLLHITIEGEKKWFACSQLYRTEHCHEALQELN